MSINAELNKSFEKIAMDFLHRAIAREITSMLELHDSPGRMLIDASRWSKAWNIPESDVWVVIDNLEKIGFWTQNCEAAGNYLVCRSLHEAAKSIKKSRKASGMKALKDNAREQRANDLSLSCANLAHRSMFAEVAQRVDFEQRYELLKNPYDGWLPSSAYSASGLVFRPDGAFKEKLAQEFDDVDLDLALFLMYEDLRDHHRQRPSIDAFPFWMRTWLKNHREQSKKSDADDTSELDITSLLDNL